MTEEYASPRPDGPLAIGRRVSADDLVYAQLREMFAQQQLAPGRQISEEALATTLGVSRTPLRQALARFRFEGLVEREANGRLRVTTLSAEDARNVFAVRIALEELALEQSFARLTEDLLLSLRGLLAQMAVLDQEGGQTVGHFGGEFHALLYRNGGNDVNLSMLSLLQGRIDRYRFLSTATGVRRQRSAVQEHALILEALEHRDLPTAKQALRQHLERARGSVLDALRPDPNPEPLKANS